MSNKITICNFDGLVGPTHNYAGLSFGNKASMQNKNVTSNPQAAALQGLKLMQVTLDIVGIQGFIPFQLRPNFKLLYDHGFGSNEKRALAKAYSERPDILCASWSASSMWTANAATVTFGQDQKIHLTPASLQTMLHRNQEVIETAHHLKNIFNNSERYIHHDAVNYPDEGAANHMHCGDHDVFVYGNSQSKFPARQSFDAFKIIAKNHKVKNPIFLEQSIDAIEAGAFHNDVVAVSHNHFVLYHEKAFSDDKPIYNKGLNLLRISDNLLPLDKAIKTYLFNSRIVTDHKTNEYIIIAPAQVEEDKDARNTVDFILSSDNPVSKIIYMDLNQSMSNGGGPACLRLRVPVTNNDDINQTYLLNHAKIEKLRGFVKSHYRDRVEPSDLCDLDFAHEVYAVYHAFQDYLLTHG